MNVACSELRWYSRLHSRALLIAFMTLFSKYASLQAHVPWLASYHCVAPCVLMGTHTPCCERTVLNLISWLSRQIICAWSAGLTANLHSYKSPAPCSGSPWVPDVTLTRKTQQSCEFVPADSWHYHLCCSGMTQHARKFSKHAKRCWPLPRSWCTWVMAPRKCWPLPFSSLQLRMATCP